MPRAVHDPQADALEALHELLLDLGQALLGDAPAQVERLGAHAAHADHARGDPGGALDVAAHAVGVLAVEDVLGGHGAERPDEVADVLVAPAREALLLLDRLVVSQRAAAHADRQPRGEDVVHVDVAGHGVTGLVDGDRAALLVDVVHADRGARLDRRHRLDDVLAVELLARLGVRVGQRHRAHLLDHGRGVPVGHARQLVAALGAVEVLVVADAVQVEVEDVLAVVLGRRAEPDVAAHAPGADERRVERVEGHVGGADEVDLLGPRLGRLDAQAQPADPARDDVGRVEERVEAVGEELAHHRRLVDAVHLHQQLVERQPAAHAAHAREHDALDAVAHGAQRARRGRRRAARRAT